MSLSGSERKRTSSTTPLIQDKSPTDYNAETDTDDENHDSKSETETNIQFSVFDGFPLHRFKRLAPKMYFVAKEIAIMFFLALTYAALTNNPSKISKSPPAVPFFPKSSVIEDWYRGDFNAPLAKARQSDISFIMFYAPWDADCQSVRNEFEIAATFMRKQVTFVAVNCWQPGSECRNQYSKAYKWPILIAYLSRGKGIHYKGITTAPYMVKFLTALSKPLIRIYDESEARGVHALSEALVLGCVNALPGSSDYAVLYSVAINNLENDPAQEVPFAVLTGVNTTCVGSHNGRALTLQLWNETLVYPQNAEWKPDEIISWIRSNIHKISPWVLPSGTKSLSLSTYLQLGPTLILFTPKNPLALKEDYHSLLHGVAMEFHDCGENILVKLSSTLLLTMRLDNYFKYKISLEECGVHQKSNKQQSFPSVVTYTLPERWTNESRKKHSKCSTSNSLNDRFPTDCKNSNAEYQHKYHKNSNFYRACDANEKKLTNDTLPQDSGNTWEEERCKRVLFAYRVHPSVFSDTITEFKPISASCKGLRCTTNVTLSFIALDSIRHYHFAERLGIDLSKRKDRTATVIINDQMETHHVMQDNVNDETLRQFVVNFVNGNIPRAMVSETNVRRRHTHAYLSKKACRSKDASQFCLTELNSETFLPTVLQQGQVVVVLYYTKQCSFCSGISYTFLTVAKMFSSVSAIKFVRIDGDVNLLPWEFTMERYPTILFFPFRRKAETRVFPQDMPINVSNLVSFLLSNLNPTLKLHAMWTLCKQAELKDDKLLCNASTRSENLSLIEHTLRMWRTSDVLTKAKLLHRLQQLRNINLLLALDQQNSDLDLYLTQLHGSTDERVYVKTNSENKRDKEEL